MLLYVIKRFPVFFLPSDNFPGIVIVVAVFPVFFVLCQENEESQGENVLRSLKMTAQLLLIVFLAYWSVQSMPTINVIRAFKV